MTASPPPILVAGGGIAGLATALALAPRNVAVLERRAAFSEAGAGIQISPNGVRALQALGVADRLEPHVGTPTAIVVRDGATGHELQRLPLGRWIAERHGAPYWVAHRRDLQDALLAACREQPGIELRLGCDMTRVSEVATSRGAGVSVVDAAGASIIGAALIGADGVFSKLRAHVDGRAPRFSGRTAARAVIAADAVRANLGLDATGVWLAPRSHVVHYPVRGAREIAVVIIRSEDWRTEDSRETGWSAPVAPDWLDTALAPFAPALRELLAAAPAGDWRKWALFEAPVPRRWSRGHIALVGDAAHPVLPFLAQGGSLALEDAVVLASALKAEPDSEQAFATYSRARWRRTARIAAAARRNGRIFHLSGLAARARDLALRSLSPESVMAGYDWVYGWRPPE